MKPISLPHISNAFHFQHKNRLESGGFSAISMSQDCRSMLIVSDYSEVPNLEQYNQQVIRSQWFKLQNQLAENGTLKSSLVVDRGQLKDLNGKQLSGATESLDQFNDGYVTTLDSHGNVWFYANLNTVPTVLSKQPNYSQGNAGLETIAVFNENTLFTLWEKAKPKQTSVKGHLIKLNGDTVILDYKAVASPKDATVLNNGDLIILEKDWLGKKGSRLRLVHVNGQKLLNEHLFEQTVLFDQTSVEYDNFEGMDSCYAAESEWLYIISDDNGDWLYEQIEAKGRIRQKTLLLNINVSQLLKNAKALN